MKKRAAAQAPEVAEGVTAIEAAVAQARIVADGLRDSDEQDPARLRVSLAAAVATLDYLTDVVEGGAR